VFWLMEAVSCQISMNSYNPEDYNLNSRITFKITTQTLTNFNGSILNNEYKSLTSFVIFLKRRLLDPLPK